MIFAAVPSAENQHVNAFVARHQTGLWRWLRALGCEASHAEEHCQDALLAGLQHDIDRLPAADANRWLRTTAKNLFLMQLRSEKRRPRWIAFDEIEATWQALCLDEDDGSAALSALSRCLLALAARDRDLITRRYELRQARTTIAAELAIGEAGVKQALRRLRDKLRSCVQRRLLADENNPTTTQQDGARREAKL